MLLSLPEGTWLASQPEEFQRRIASIARFRELRAGDPIWNIGDESRGLMGIVAGCAAVSWTTPDDGVALLHLMWPGDWMGEHAFITGAPYRTGIQARTETTIVTVASGPLEEVLSENGDWWRSIAFMSTQHAVLAADTWVDMLMRSHFSRCLSVLLRGAGSRIQSRDKVRSRIVPLSHEELGSLTNLSRNAVGAILHELQSDGLIECHYRSIHLKDVEGLRASLKQRLSVEE